METTPIIGSLESATSEFESPSTTLEQAGLDRDAFLTIFLAQIENQDPLEPQDASELGAQLATFSQLEQSIRMTEELGGVNERLDQLINATRARTESALDPVGLIGHTVDIQADQLFVPEAGESGRLRAEVGDAGTEFLLVEASDVAERSIGIAVVGRSDAEGQPVPLARGIYEIFFTDGGARVRHPDGEVSPLTFESLTLDESGNVVVGEDGSPSEQLVAGASYGFGATATGRSSNGSFSSPVAMTTTGTVSSVRLVDGLPMLTVAGQEIDPSNIVRIR